MKYEAVVFDFDGTLFDTAPNDLKTLAGFVKQATGSYPVEEKLSHVCGMTGHKAMEYLGCNQKQMDWIWPQWYEASVQALKTTPMFEGMKEVLLELDRIKVALGIVTSRDIRGVRVGLEAHGIFAYFKELVCQEDTERHKPAPDPLLACAKRLGIETNRILYVGDNAVDMICAKDAGADSGLALWGAHDSELECKYRFMRPQDILTLFDT